jgi:TctA family transporter
MSMIDAMTLGLSEALRLENFLYCLLGASLGTFLGVLPGIGVFVSISLLFPITLHLEPTAGLIMLAGLYYGTLYGGSTASILLNVPGTPSNAVACLDGYPMAQQGRAGVALLVSSISSFVGGSFAIVLLLGFSTTIAENALRFQSPEYFSLMVLGLVAASVIGTGRLSKGLASVVLGVFLGTIGMDLISGVQRFDLGINGLADGIPIVALAMGLFGVTEVIGSIREQCSRASHALASVSFRSMIPTRDDTRRSVGSTARGSLLGAFVGTLPGTGGFITSFMSYAVERSISKNPKRFGKGAIEGLAAPEASNNAADVAAFIPTLTLGIPGTPVLAILLGVLIIHGINPGPNLVFDEPELFWGLVMSFWIGNIVLLFLNVPLIGLWIKVLAIPYRILFPAIIVFVCIGTYSVNANAFDILILAAFTAVGYTFRLLGYSPAPLILGFVLGPMLEENLRRSLLVSRGDPSVFIDRPIALAILLLTLAIIAIPLVASAWRSRKGEVRSSVDD